MFNVIRSRWRNAMPKFFKRLCWVCSLISGTALAANEAMQVAGVQPHEWWTDVAPYLIGVPAGIAFASKFTQQYTGEPISPSSCHLDQNSSSCHLDQAQRVERSPND